MSARKAIGVDLGGTRVRAGVITEAGELLGQSEAGIAGVGPDRGLIIIQDLIAQLTEALDAPIAGIGIGATGPIDRARGVINNPYTLEGWVEVPILESLQSRFGVPARLDNDANAAALGELWQGAGRGAHRMYAVTIGTGVGTSYIVDGRLQRGAGEVHPEGGHQLIDPDGPECYCGQRGCWESLIAGPSIARRARQVAEARGWKPTADDSGSRFEARKLAWAARRGDAFAEQVLHEVALDLGRGLVNIILLFVPEVIVLGGGVMESSDLFLPTVLEVIRTEHPMVPFDQVRIAPAQLGDRAGLFGGARMILRESP
ncbi:MAG TPA: ROK family protein [Paracoccaceae bacterium]|nr:ROK family protein [Paracoccaceae bacterium]